MQLVSTIAAIAICIVATGQVSVPDGTISGRVVDALTGQAVPGVNVYSTLDRWQRISGRSVADVDGRFAIAAPAGFVQLWSMKLGYHDGWFGQRTATGAGARVVVDAGKTRGDVVIRLWPLGVITGRVLDHKGAPKGGAEIRVLRQASEFDRAGWVADGPRSTSDRSGRFRMTSVRAGDYVIAMASPDVGLNNAYPSLALGADDTAYFPGVTSVADATRVSMEAGGDVELGDLRLPARAEITSIRGTLLGHVPAEWEAELVPIATGSWSQLDVKRTMVTPEGTFAFPAVVRGRYLIRVRGLAGWSNTLSLNGSRAYIPMPLHYERTDAPMARMLWAESEVVVGDKPVQLVVLQVMPGARIRGTLVFDGDGRPSVDGILSAVMFLNRTDGRDLRRVPTTIFNAEGAFVSPAHPSGTYAPSLHRIEGWRAESVSVAGARLVDGRLEIGNVDVQDVTIRMTNRLAGLEGTMRAAGGTREPVTAIVFPTDRRLWTSYSSQDGRVQAALADAEGRYLFTGLLPGEYFVSAIGGDLPDNWRSSEYLSSRIAVATRVTLSHGTHTLNLTAGK